TYLTRGLPGFEGIHRSHGLTAGTASHIESPPSQRVEASTSISEWHGQSLVIESWWTFRADPATRLNPSVQTKETWSLGKDGTLRIDTVSDDRVARKARAVYRRVPDRALAAGLPQPLPSNAAAAAGVTWLGYRFGMTANDLRAVPACKHRDYHDVVRDAQ